MTDKKKLCATQRMFTYQQAKRLALKATDLFVCTLCGAWHSKAESK